MKTPEERAKAVLKTFWWGLSLETSSTQIDAVAAAIREAVLEERAACAEAIRQLPGRDWYAEADRDPESVETTTIRTAAASIHGRPAP